MKCVCSGPCDSRNAKDWALLALRVALGVIFIAHGYSKLMGMDGVTGMVMKLGFPAPGFFAYVLALTEFLGGIALLVGVFTSIASILIIIVMLVAIFGMKGLYLPAIDPDLSLLVMAIAVLLMGPGRFSVAASLCKGCLGNGSCANKEGMMMEKGGNGKKK